MKKCTRCGEAKGLSEFGVKTAALDGRKSACRICSRIDERNRAREARKDPEKLAKMNANSRKYWKNGKGQLRKFSWKKKLVDHFGGKCSVCGYDKCYSALEFHHKDPTQKEFSITSNKIRESTWDRCVEEAGKCVLLCSNCHREQHYLKNEEAYLIKLKEEDIPSGVVV